MRSTSDRRRRCHGGTLVEMAFALLPTIAFLMGIFDVSFAIFVKSTLQFAVRQGVRYAITSQTMAGLGQDNSIKTVIINDTMGLLNTMSPNQNGMQQINITYYNPVTLLPVTGVGSNIGGNIVVVTASGLSWAWMFPLLRSATPLQFSAASADVMEGSPIGGPPAR